MNCPRCAKPTLERTAGKVVDAESTRIVETVSCRRCEFVEELDVVAYGKSLKRA